MISRSKPVTDDFSSSQEGSNLSTLKPRSNRLVVSIYYTCTPQGSTGWFCSGSPSPAGKAGIWYYALVNTEVVLMTLWQLLLCQLCGATTREVPEKRPHLTISNKLYQLNSCPSFVLIKRKKLGKEFKLWLPCKCYAFQPLNETTTRVFDSLTRSLGRRLGHCKILHVSVDHNPVLWPKSDGYTRRLGTTGCIYVHTPSIVVF